MKTFIVKIAQGGYASEIYQRTGVDFIVQFAEEAAKFDSREDAQEYINENCVTTGFANVAELTYDVQFNDNNNSNSKGFELSSEECAEYIEKHNGTDESYFKDYKGGTASIVNSEGETVFETGIPR